jgi:putative cell wall-binding protein
VAALALSTLAAAPANAAEPAAPALALAAAPAAAEADSFPVADAQFRWGFSNEANNKGYAPGTYNLFSAGKLPSTGPNTSVTAATWSASNGNVSIEKQQADGSYAAATFAGLSTQPDGSPIPNPTSGKFSNHQVVVGNGTGTVDPANQDAEITWDGDFTVAFYSGLTFFYVSDPTLDVDNGIGTVTATLGGYKASMTDPTLWEPIADTVVTLADLGDVEVSETGFTTTPDYAGVEVTTPETATAQNRTGPDWGAFPQSFVDFQQLTGQSSYWYSSGGGTDANKPALPITVSYTAKAVPTVTVSKTEGLDPNGETITVTGTGFVTDDPAAIGTRAPLVGKFGGVYVAFGKFLDVWQPSAGAPGSARAGIRDATKWAVPADSLATIGGAAAGGVTLAADGSFSVQLSVKKGFSGALADGNLGIYTYSGSGAKAAAFETFTPVSFEGPSVDRIEGATRTDVAVNVSKKAYPNGSDVAYIVTGNTFADALSAAPAAVKEKAPLLLTAPDALPAVVKAELQRLTPNKIVIVGGPNSVSEAVKSTLEGLAGDVVRLSGADRYEASRTVVDYAFGTSGAKNAYVATGANFPDALSASAAGGATATPVLLVNGGASSIDAPTSALLTKLGVDTVSIAGGPNSVADGVKASIEALAAKTKPESKVVVTRLSGADRFAASISINNSAFSWANTVYLATGYNYPDALAGAALAGLRGAPLYVVPTECVPQGVLADIDRLGAGQVTLLGGPNSLSPAVQSLKGCSF